MNPRRDIVVIGASLGGVTAIAKIALTWPAHLPVTVLVALSFPEQPAPMVLQVIDGYAPVAVSFAKHGEAIKPRRIYLSPPGRHLVVGKGGLLELDDGKPFESPKPSVDRLFSSAAAEFGARVIGIVLSGNAKDGARGLTAIGRAGGVAIVQQPADATASEMPTFAIERDSPDYCVKASEIASLVQRLVDPAHPR